jgi:hypothetical protein
MVLPRLLASDKNPLLKFCVHHRTKSVDTAQHDKQFNTTEMYTQYRSTDI